MKSKFNNYFIIFSTNKPYDIDEVTLSKEDIKQGFLKDFIKNELKGEIKKKNDMKNIVEMDIINRATGEKETVNMFINGEAVLYEDLKDLQLN